MNDIKIMELANDIAVFIHESSIYLSQGLASYKWSKSEYRARQKLFAVRKNLRKSDKYKPVFFNEDITSRRSNVLYSARILFL